MTCFVKLFTYFTDSEMKPQNAQNTLDIAFTIFLSALCLYAYLMSFRTRYSGIFSISHKKDHEKVLNIAVQRLIKYP